RGPYRYEAFFEETARLIAQSRNPHLKLFISEWNAQSTDWRTGLYCGGILNAFERTGDVVEIASPALFLRHISATAWDNAFINFDHRRWFPAPNYVIMKLWRDNFAPERIAAEGVPEDLNLVATRDPQQGVVIVKVVNPGKEARRVSVKVAGQAIESATAQKVAPGDLLARNTLDQPDAVRAEKADVALVDGAATMELPALSCVVLRLSVK
ncbi:MAG: alpha-L-arabinofuranosidase, partial [Thermogutta sp.]|uniref:alpha-L-arabinofuranosidase C-terminal domain-containing protein n=1 Tax=Thermogutta sp. TaxID=1962930 RepID=UPI0019A7A545